MRPTHCDICDRDRNARSMENGQGIAVDNDRMQDAGFLALARYGRLPRCPWFALSSGERLLVLLNILRRQSRYDHSSDPLLLLVYLIFLFAGLCFCLVLLALR